uniref:Retrovirus-related Pol polyprotein from type-1 retrotransposable element R2 n=1 Tax=Lygus hesperus TaxID=30085 RepID=A0A146LAL6_LYGHE
MRKFNPLSRSLWITWEPLLSAPSHKPRGPVVPLATARDYLLGVMCVPVLHDQADKCCVENSTFAGPDGISACRWNKVPKTVKLLILNLLLLAGRSSKALTRAQTVFTPKKGGRGPGGCQRISVSSVVFHHSQKILVPRFQVAGVIGDVQREFWHADGTAENLTVLQTVIPLAPIKKQQLHLAALDVAKALALSVTLP